MPNLGFGEIIVILLVALLVFGPRKLPEIGRTLGKSMREFRRATSGLRAEIEADLDDEEEGGTRARSDWQRRKHASSNGAPSTEPADRGEPAPDDSAPSSGPDPAGGSRD
jgi:sec-independent protein translocase protein TatA